MPVVLVHEGPTLTQERYEETVRQLTGGKGRLEKPTDWPVDGLLVHTAGQGPNGFRGLAVLGCRGGAPRLGGKLMPVLQEIGITEQPEVYPAHTFVSA